MTTKRLDLFLAHPLRKWVYNGLKVDSAFPSTTGSGMLAFTPGSMWHGPAFARQGLMQFGAQPEQAEEAGAFWLRDPAEIGASQLN